MSLGLVLLPVTKGVFTAERQPEVREPAIVLDRLADPDSTWVIGMRLAICIRKKVVRIYDPVGAVEELGGFKNHLDDMLVAMILGGFAGDEREDEDIHGGRSPLIWTT
jgi:hypothetical protein